MEKKQIVMEIPREFQKLFENGWREAAIHGGRYSLKSHTVARYLLIRARQSKTRIACFREFQNSIAESSHQLLSDLIKQYELNDFEVTNNSIINTQTKSDFIFKGLHQNEQSVKSVEGIDIAWVEEAQTVSRESLEVLTPTVRKPGSQIIYTYNRLLEDDPVHQRLVVEGRPDTLIINVNYDIAIKYKMIPEVILKEIEDDKANRPALYKHKWLGEPNSFERKIYTNWAIIDEIPHEAELVRYGLDFGYTNDPTVIVAIYKYNGGFIFDEICYQKGLSNKSIHDILSNIDSALVIADSAEPKSINEIKMFGTNIMGAQKGPGSVSQGINFVQSQKCSVTKRSINTIKAYRNYLYFADRDGKITNDPDDSVHEWSNCLVGNTKIELLGGKTKNIKNVKVGDIVRTKNGYNKCVASWLDKKNAEIYEVVLSNGYTVKGTGNHKIYTSRGKVAIDSLRYDDIIEVVNNKKLLKWKKSLLITGANIIEMVNIIRDICPGKMGKDRQDYYIEKFGKVLMEKYQKDSIFIIKTLIPKIMKLIILKLLMARNTYQNIIKETGTNKNLEKKLEKIAITLEFLQKNGIHQIKEKNGTVYTEKKVGMEGNYIIKIVKFVEKNIAHIFLIEADSAIKIAKLKRCGKEDVYNLTIDKEHNYYANGILVGNSMDAIRYGLSGYIERRENSMQKALNKLKRQKMMENSRFRM